MYILFIFYCRVADDDIMIYALCMVVLYVVDSKARK